MSSQLVIALDNLDATIHLFDPSIELEEIRKRPLPPAIMPSTAPPSGTQNDR